MPSVSEEILDQLISAHGLNNLAGKPPSAPTDTDLFSPQNKIICQCAFMRHCHDDAFSLSELEWYAMITNAVHLDRGVDFVHDLSRSYPKYSRAETDQKILHAMNDSGPMTCAKIASENDEFCKGCSHKGDVKSPIGLVNRFADKRADQETPETATLYDEEPLSAGDMGLHLPKSRDYIFDGPGGLLRGKVGSCSGQGGAGKTTAVTQIAASIVSGVNCTGGVFSIKCRGPVLAVLSEDQAEDTERIIYHLRQEYGDLSISNFRIIPQRSGDPRLFIRDSSGNVRSTRGFPKLKNWVAEIKPLLLILDSYSVLMGDTEMNNSDAAFAISTISELCDIGNRTTVLLLTHSNKTSIATKGQAGKKAKPEAVLEASLDPNSVRGASAIVNNTRWVMTMTLVPAGVRKKLGCPRETMLTAYAVRKTNYSRPLELAFLEHDVRRWAPGVESMILKPLQFDEVRKVTDEEHKHNIVEMLREYPGAITKRDFMNDAVAAETLFLSRDKLRELVLKLVDEDRLTVSQDGKRKLLTVSEVING